MQFFPVPRPLVVHDEFATRTAGSALYRLLAFAAKNEADDSHESQKKLYLNGDSKKIENHRNCLFVARRRASPVAAN